MKSTVSSSLAAAIGVALLVGCSRQQPIDAADLIITGGDIVTMNDKQATAEAVAIKDALIVAVGTRADVERAHKGATTRIVDLGEKTLLPGFLDAHSHYMSSLTVANQVNVYAPPAGPGKDPESIVAELVKYRDRNKTPKGEVIQAWDTTKTSCPTAVRSIATTWTALFPTIRCWWATSRCTARCSIRLR